MKIFKKANKTFDQIVAGVYTPCYTSPMTTTTLQIAAVGTSTWISVRSFATGSELVAYDEARRIFRESAGTLDTRLLDAGEPIPRVTFTNTVD